MLNKCIRCVYGITLFSLLMASEWACHSVQVDVAEISLRVPEGFEVITVVDSIAGAARHIAVNGNGDVYVKSKFGRKPDDTGEGRDRQPLEHNEGNVAIRDIDGDGRADIIEYFGVYECGPYGTEMRIRNGYIYFSSELAVYRQKLVPGKLVPDGPVDTVVIDDHPHGYHQHIAKPIAFDNEGHIYVPFGAPSNACQVEGRTPWSPGIDPCPQLEDHGGIWRFDEDKLNQRQQDGIKYASGIRSVVGMAWNEEADELFVLMHGRDDLMRLFPEQFNPLQSAELPSEELLKVVEGSDFGWPYCYYDQIQNKKVLAPEYGGDGLIVGRCSEYDDPVIGFPGHWAPNDMLFYKGNQFPERYLEGAFIAFHGSTNRAPYPQAGYFICFLPFENGSPTGEWEVFANGFAGVDPIESVSDAVYRPMGIAEGPDGSLYISDTEKGRMWNISFHGDKATFGPEELAQMEMEKQKSNIRRPDPIQDDLQRDVTTLGEQVYYSYCGTCHQQNGMGASGRFPPLAETDWVTGDKERLIQVVMHGLEGSIEVNGESYNGHMPQHSFLSDEQIAQVLTYIRQNFGNNAGPISEDEVSAVRNQLESIIQ